MTTRLKNILFLAVLGMLASACSAASHAATIDGTHISDEDVFAIRATQPDATAVGETFRGDLTTLIVTRATSLAASADFGLDDMESDAARQAFVATALPDELAILNSVAANQDLGPYAYDVVATQLAIRRAVASAIAHDPEFQQDIWDNDRDLLLEVCASHILAPTEEEAQAAKDRIDAGEDFAAVAGEVSLDQQSPGGALPCPSSPARFVQPFSSVVATAPVGELTVPFETEFGWHIVFVDSRAEPASFEEFVADPERWIPATRLASAYGLWRDEAVGRANIYVRSQVGIWFPQADGIIAPPASP